MRENAYPAYEEATIALGRIILVYPGLPGGLRRQQRPAGRVEGMSMIGTIDPVSGRRDD